MVLEKTLESPLDCKDIKPVIPNGNQSWVFIGKTDAEAEAPIFWPPDAKSQLIGKYPDAEKYWRQEEKQMSEDEMVDDITDSMDMSLSKLWEMVKDRAALHAIVHGVAESDTTEWLSKRIIRVRQTRELVQNLRTYWHLVHLGAGSAFAPKSISLNFCLRHFACLTLAIVLALSFIKFHNIV